MKKTQKRSYISWLFLAIFSFTLLFSGLKPEMATAAPYSKDSVQKRAEAWILGSAVARCIDDNGFEEENHRDAHMEEGKWLHGDAHVGEYAAELAIEDNNSDKASCEEVAKAALKAIGTTAVKAICKMNEIAGEDLWERSRASDSCEDGTGDLDFQEGDGKFSSKRSATWNDFFRETYLEGKGIKESLTDGMRYIIYSENFWNECGHEDGGGFKVRQWQAGDSDSDKYTYKLRWNKEGATPDKDWRVASEQHDKSHSINAGGSWLNFSESKIGTCEQLAAKINQYAEKVIEENGGSATDTEGDGPAGQVGDGNTDPTCESVSGPGAWILCLVVDVLDKSISLLDEQVKSLLFVDKSVYANATVTAAWESMRNLALLVLVPMMMFMVIGTALNFGPFDPYTVKKALPRMFVATIFIVLSLPVTQFAVQVSNSLGQGLGNMITYAAPTSVESLKDIFTAAEGGSQEGLGWTAIIAGTAAFAVGGIGALISFGMVAVVGLLIGFSVLILRQVLIILLIVIAPLAILAWIFPGNDKLWGLWKGTFIAMLLMFPIISMLLASGRFVAGIIGG